MIKLRACLWHCNDAMTRVHTKISGCPDEGWSYSASAAFFAFVKRSDARGLGHSSCWTLCGLYSYMGRIWRSETLQRLGGATANITTKSLVFQEDICSLLNHPKHPQFWSAIDLPWQNFEAVFEAMLNWIGKLKPLKKQKSTFLFLPRTFGQLKRGLNWLLRWILCKVGDLITSTVGVIRNETLVFVNFWAQNASILKISVPISKRRSWGF